MGDDDGDSSTAGPIRLEYGRPEVDLSIRRFHEVTPPGWFVATITVVWAGLCLWIGSDVGVDRAGPVWGWAIGAFQLCVWTLKCVAALAVHGRSILPRDRRDRVRWLFVPIVVATVTALLWLNIPMRLRFAVGYSALHAAAKSVEAGRSWPPAGDDAGLFFVNRIDQVAGSDVVWIFTSNWNRHWGPNQYHGFAYIGPSARPADAPPPDHRLWMGGHWYAFR